MQLFKMIVHNTVSSVNIETAVLFFLYVPSTQNSAWHILAVKYLLHEWINDWMPMKTVRQHQKCFLYGIK